MDETMPADLTWEQQLIMLRALMERTGALHEAQALQIRLWPFTVDPKLPAEGQEAHLDLENKKILYAWVDPERPKDWKPDKAYEGRMATLAKWTQWILGKFRVEITFNNETIFVKDRDRKDRKDRKRGSKRRNRKKRRKGNS